MTLPRSMSAGEEKVKEEDDGVTSTSAPSDSTYEEYIKTRRERGENV